MFLLFCIQPSFHVILLCAVGECHGNILEQNCLTSNVKIKSVNVSHNLNMQLFVVHIYVCSIPFFLQSLKFYRNRSSTLWCHEKLCFPNKSKHRKSCKISPFQIKIPYCILAIQTPPWPFRWISATLLYIYIIPFFAIDVYILALFVQHKMNGIYRLVKYSIIRNMH